MTREQSCHKFIYKLQSKRLAQAGWNLTLPLSLRWIIELNGNEDILAYY